MNRRKAREYALQMLFQHEFAGQEQKKFSPDDFLSELKDNKEQKEFAGELVKGTLENLELIDSVIQKAAANWDLDRMAAVDRNILRSAVYEILFRNDIPPAVTINESLEIAKKFSSSESAPFINGLLDKIAKDKEKA
jgi:N utilization substance protein B